MLAVGRHPELTLVLLDREVVGILAEANRRSEEIRGAGDAERNKVFAEAFGKDPGFFSFYRSMQAYEQSMRQGDTRMILSPTSEFFRYFGDPNGRGTATARPPAPAAPTPAPAGN